MLAFKFEVSRRATKRGLTLESLTKTMAGNGAQALANAVSNRVRKHGDLAGQSFPGYSTKRRWKAVAPNYPDSGGGIPGPSGARWFRSGADYQREQGTQSGTYDITGGMWDGLSVVFNSANNAEIMFRGRSTGRDPNFKRRTVGRPKKGHKGPRRSRAVANGLRINNALKASTILQQHGINVLLPSERELEAYTDAMVCCAAFLADARIPGVEWDQALLQPLPPAQAFAAQDWF